MFHVKVKGVSSAEWIVENVSQNPERGVRGKKWGGTLTWNQWDSLTVCFF